MDDLHILRSPSLWPEFPYLRVERRLDLRFDQPVCFVYAAGPNVVVPRVFFTQKFPPGNEQFSVETNLGLTYPDLAALAGDGWRVIDS
jgi:hypothetical protein